MIWMFEVYYRPPLDSAREERCTVIVSKHGGQLDFREAPEVDGSDNICLTFELMALSNAEAAAGELRGLGEHVEGPCQYS